jgi:hypothetical protein
MENLLMGLRIARSGEGITWHRNGHQSEKKPPVPIQNFARNLRLSL